MLITVPRVKMQKCSQINSGSKLIGKENIFIGKHVVVGYNCLLMTSTDSIAPRMDDGSPENMRKIVSSPIRIDDYAYIGSNSIICPGVHIGNHAVIGAQSYVKKFSDIKPYTVSWGNPLKYIKTR
ncbi:MAG: acyltransferase [Candidatus Daviesbacteria bacterium]|nr:acyltransferase [Candidatus Daviesbacteria bacterium]